MHRALVMRLVAPCFAHLSLGLPALADAGTRVSGPVAHDNLAVYFVYGPVQPERPVIERIQPAIRYGTHCGWVPVMKEDKKGEKYFTGIVEWHCH